MSEYDAAAVIEERETLAEPRWLWFDCPKCDARAGFRCERGWSHGHEPARHPHVARKRASALFLWRCPSCQGGGEPASCNRDQRQCRACGAVAEEYRFVASNPVRRRS